MEMSLPRIQGLLLAVAAGGLLLGTPAVYAADCGFPWTVSAKAAGTGIVAVNVCGRFIGCSPHDPQFIVSEGQIELSLTQYGRPPECNQCVQVEGHIDQTFFINSVPLGVYKIIVKMVNCNTTETYGTTDFTLDPTFGIPLLDKRALSLFAIVLAAAALWRLRI